MKAARVSNKNISGSVSFRPGRIDDIENLVAINEKWQRTKLQTTSNGFLSALIDERSFKLIVKKKEILLAVDETNALAGYYLLINSAIPSVFIKQVSKVKDLKSKNEIPFLATVGVGAQVLVNEEFHGTELRSMLLKEFKEYLKNDYDYLFSSVSKSNSKAYYVHLKDGWKILNEDGEAFYVLLEL